MKRYLIFLLLTIPLWGYGQSISGSTEVCPNVPINYTCSFGKPNDMQGASVQIQLTYGKFDDGRTDKTLWIDRGVSSCAFTVIWDDIPTNQARIYVGGSFFSVNKYFFIKSIANQKPSITTSPSTNITNGILEIPRGEVGQVALKASLSYPWFQQYVVTNYRWQDATYKTLSSTNTYTVYYNETNWDNDYIYITPLPLSTVCSGGGEGATYTLKIKRTGEYEPDHLRIDNKIINIRMDYKAKQTITVSNTVISNNSKVNFTAGNLITLKPNFHAQLGTTVVIKATGATATRSAAVEVESASDITKVKSIDDIRLYPNPVQDELFVESAEAIHLLQIFNLTGQQMLAVKEVQGSIDVSQLAKGTYIVRIHTEKGIKICKIIKE